MIEVDVECAEGRVIRSQAPILDQLRPDIEIVVEVEPDRMRHLGDHIAALLDAMSEHGSHTYRLPAREMPLCPAWFTVADLVAAMRSVARLSWSSPESTPINCSNACRQLHTAGGRSMKHPTPRSVERYAGSSDIVTNAVRAHQSPGNLLQTPAPIRWDLTCTN